MELTQEMLVAAVNYDPCTGVFTNVSDVYGGFRGSVKLRSAGSEIGTKRPDGRVVIRLNGRLYLAYRLAWLYVYGEMPGGEIDHINGDPGDNRISNLRCVDRRTNQQNIRRSLKGKRSSKYLGVYLDKRKSTKKWRAAISHHGRQISLGYYASEVEARDVYLRAKRSLHAGCTI